MGKKHNRKEGDFPQKELDPAIEKTKNSTEKLMAANAAMWRNLVERCSTFGATPNLDGNELRFQALLKTLLDYQIIDEGFMADVDNTYQVTVSNMIAGLLEQAKQAEAEIQARKAFVRPAGAAASNSAGALHLPNGRVHNVPKAVPPVSEVVHQAANQESGS